MTETRKVGVATMYTREERERRKRIHKTRVRVNDGVPLLLATPTYLKAICDAFPHCTFRNGSRAREEWLRQTEPQEACRASAVAGQLGTVQAGSQLHKGSRRPLSALGADWMRAVQVTGSICLALGQFSGGR